MTADQFTLGVACASSVFASLVAFASFRQAKIAKQTAETIEENGKIQTLLDVRDSWTECLSHIYKFRQNRVDYTGLRDKFDNLQDFMADELWQGRLRQICNFYEYVGLLVHHEILEANTILVFVTVEPGDRKIADEAITWLREDYKEDIYLYWDWLIEKTSGIEALDPFVTFSKAKL